MNSQQDETDSCRLPSLQRSSSISPFTFAYRTIAHEGHPERNEDVANRAADATPPPVH